MKSNDHRVYHCLSAKYYSFSPCHHLILGIFVYIKILNEKRSISHSPSSPGLCRICPQCPFHLSCQPKSMDAFLGENEFYLLFVCIGHLLLFFPHLPQGGCTESKKNTSCDQFMLFSYTRPNLLRHRSGRCSNVPPGDSKQSMVMPTLLSLCYHYFYFIRVVFSGQKLLVFDWNWEATNQVLPAGFFHFLSHRPFYKPHSSLFGNLQIEWIGSLLHHHHGCLHHLFYSQYRLMDINFVFKKGTTYVLLTLVLLIPAVFLIMLTQKIFFKEIHYLFTAIVFEFYSGSIFL